MGSKPPAERAHAAAGPDSSIFQLLIEGVRDYAIFMLDPEGYVRTWNAGAQLLKGYSAEEIIGSHMSRFYPPDAIKRNWPQYELRIATLEGRFEDEGWRIRKDGTRFWANVLITAMRDSTGTLRGFTKITRDLSDRRRHEEELRQSEERFRLLIEGVSEYAILMLDPSGIVSSWNSGAEQVMGYKASEVIGRHFSHFYRPDDIAANKPWRELATARVEGRVRDEGWRVRNDGSQFWASTTITALRDPDGKLYGFAKVTRDRTQDRRAEALEVAATRMSEFIALLAHELRNPLAPIRNAVTLMGKKGVGDPLLEAMRQTIDRQSEHLAHIVDELLDVNRIVRGKFAVNEQAIDLREPIARAIEASRPLIDRFRHSLHVSIPDEPIPLRGDPMRLTQALVNLLNNAANYTPQEGRISLTVETSGTEARIRIRDNGVGIAPPALRTVFDLFVQGEPVPGRSGGGLGVGLALVQRIVELHGGRVEAHSEGTGHGSEFVVHLPAALDPLQAMAPAAPAIENVPRRRVLIVDDNVDGAVSLGLLVQAMGSETSVVHSGPAALEAVKSFHPQVILLDIGMPGMDGYELARILRANPQTRGLVLAAVTGWGQEVDKQRARDAGFDYHFIKPVAERDLQRMLTETAPG